ncbi:MAG: UvrD-helicase domain-containing protein [Phycisphaeraceae bacterium]|nr:UvrD-helicase domain-containing protein [Phycisphaeraceae bacterium]
MTHDDNPLPASLEELGIDPEPAHGGSAEDRLLADLTEAQREAVVFGDGPLLVLAGPGSGKTRVITRRIAHLVHRGVPPWRICAVTFTNKAAGEMRARVGALLGIAGPDDAAPEPPRGLIVSTFHSLCARVLRRHVDLLDIPGLTPTYAIYDTTDQRALMKRIIKNNGMDTGNWSPRNVLGAISAAKNELTDAASYAQHAGEFYTRTIAKLYQLYERDLRRANAVDFDDLLMLTVKVLSSSEEARMSVSGRFSHLLIDEYQDTNRAQFVIASLIAQRDDGRRPNICVVGDPDQSIYGWRGADISNILEFEKHYPGATTIALGQSFRSTKRIIGTADTLIRHNTQRRHKDLFTERPEGEPIAVTHCIDERHEAQIVGSWLRSLREKHDLAWGEMAVFYRTNALSRTLEDEMRVTGTPYVIARGTAFYEREEVKDVLAYLRVIANPADDVSLRRIVNKPTRGVGSTTIARVDLLATQRGISLMEGLVEASRGVVEGVSQRAANALERFLTILGAWTGEGSFMGSDVSGSLSELIERVIVESGLETHYQKLAAKHAEAADEDKVENLYEVVAGAKQFEQEYDAGADIAQDPTVDPDGNAAEIPAPPLLAMLRAFLESVSLVADADAVDPTQGAVTLMTLHAAKGLEFPAVVIVGMEEGLLPHSRSRDSISELEEERRLLFVGVTRAMDHLMCTSARTRTHHGVSERTIRSQFFDELPEEHLEINDLAGGWGSGSQRARGWDEGAAIDDNEPRYVPDPEYTSAGALDAEGLPTVGSRVRHPQFGDGVVVAVVRGMDARAKIDFGRVGVKTLILRYARLEFLG